MKKLVAGALLALSVAGLGGTAFAGEVTGSGKGGPNGDGTTPIAGHLASSECSFSGLEDGEEDPTGPSGPGTTQNWGQIPKSVRDEISQFGAHPGDACRGNAEHRVEERFGLRPDRGGPLLREGAFPRAGAPFDPPIASCPAGRLTPVSGGRHTGPSPAPRDPADRLARTRPRCPAPRGT